MLQSKYYHRPNYSFSYPPVPGQNHQYIISFICILKRYAPILQRELPFSQNRQHCVCSISIFDKSDSNSSLPCPEIVKPKTFLKLCVLHGFWHIPSQNPLFYNVIEFLLLQDHRRYEGARPIATTTTRLHIDVVHTLRSTESTIQSTSQSNIQVATQSTSQSVTSSTTQ